MAQESSLGVLVFPWLPLERKAVVGDLCFAPITVGPASQDVPSDIASKLSMFRRFYKEPSGEPSTRELKSVGKCAILAQADGVPISEFPSDHWSPVLDAIQAFCFAALAENEFWPISRFSAPYVNSSCFQSYFLGDDILVFPLRKRGPGVMQSWEYEDVVLTMPLQCSLARAVKWNDDFLSALWAVLQSDYLPESLKGLRAAIWLFDRANSDDQQELSVQHLQQEMVLAYQAMEHLLQTRGDGNLTRKAICIISGDWPVCRTQPPRTIGKWVGGLGLPKNARAVQYWLREFCQLRCDTVHAAPVEDRSWSWAVDEHAMMVAFVFPLIVKCLLAREGLYELTDADRVRLGVVDRLLSLDDWQPDQNYQESKWSKIFTDYARERRREKARTLFVELAGKGHPDQS